MGTWTGDHYALEASLCLSVILGETPTSGSEY